jgi:hypothetical protein
VDLKFGNAEIELIVVVIHQPVHAIIEVDSLAAGAAVALPALQQQRSALLCSVHERGNRPGERQALW